MLVDGREGVVPMEYGAHYPETTAERFSMAKSFFFS